MRPEMTVVSTWFKPSKSARLFRCVEELEYQDTSVFLLRLRGEGSYPSVRYEVYEKFEEAVKRAMEWMS